MVRVGEDHWDEFGYRRHHVVANRRVVEPDPQRVDKHQLSDPLGEIGRDIARHHSAERVSDQSRRAQAELVEQLVMKKREVPHVIERAMRLGVAFAGAWMVGCVDCEVARQGVVKLAPLRTPSAVQKDQRGPGTLDFHARLYFVIPYVDGAFLNSGHGSITLFWIPRG